MAKKRRSRRRGFVAIPFSTALLLSTLADNAVLDVSLLSNDNLDEDIYIMSIDGYWALDSGTVGEGPLIVGYAHGDLTEAEVAEALDVSPRSPGDIVANERARRPVRRAGQFAGAAALEVLNDGKAIRTKVRFAVENGKAINLFVSNRSGGTLTDGTRIRLQGTIYARWQV